MNENRLQRSTLRENESRAGQIPGLACSSGTVRNPQPHLRVHDAGGHRDVYGGAGA